MKIKKSEKKYSFCKNCLEKLKFKSLVGFCSKCTKIKNKKYKQKKRELTF